MNPVMVKTKRRMVWNLGQFLFNGKRPDIKAKGRMVWTEDQFLLNDDSVDKKLNYSDDQPRDERGRFGEGGSGGKGKGGGSKGKDADNDFSKLSVKKDSRGKIKGAGSLRELSEEQTFYGSDYDTNKGSPFSKQQVYALESYGQGGAGYINGDLRKGKDNSDADTINLAFKSAPKLSGEVELYRGGSFDKATIKSFKEGSVIQDKGFLSTTYNPETAESFTKYGSRDKEPVVFTVRARKGNNYIKMSGIDEDYTTGESEILFKPGTKYKIESVEKDSSGVWRVRGSI